MNITNSVWSKTRPRELSGLLPSQPSPEWRLAGWAVDGAGTLVQVGAGSPESLDRYLIRTARAADTSLSRNVFWDYSRTWKGGAWWTWSG